MKPKQMAEELQNEEKGSFEKAVCQRYQWKQENFAGTRLLHLAGLPIQTQRENVSLTVDRKMIQQQYQYKEELNCVNRKICAIEMEEKQFRQQAHRMGLKLKAAEKREREEICLRQKQVRNLEADIERAVKKLREEMDERERSYRRRTENLELYSRRQIERQAEMAETKVYRRLERELLNERRRRGL